MYFSGEPLDFKTNAFPFSLPSFSKENNRGNETTGTLPPHFGNSTVFSWRTIPEREKPDDTKPPPVFCILPLFSESKRAPSRERRITTVCSPYKQDCGASGKRFDFWQITILVPLCSVLSSKRTKRYNEQTGTYGTHLTLESRESNQREESSPQSDGCTQSTTHYPVV